MTILPDDNLAYTLAGVGRKRDPYAERRALAQKMIMQGTDTSPVQSPWQGVGRLAQALVGGVDSYITDRDEKKATDDRNTKLAAVMAEQDPQKRIGLLAGIDPELGARLTGSLAVDQAKLKQQQEGLKTAAGNFGSSYGVQPLPSPGGGSGNAGQAIAGIESGGRYDAVGPVANPQGNRAYGKYQILDTNIPAWTQEVLGQPMTPQQFLASPQAQDAVFNAKFGQYVQKYGSPEAASRAWFAGEGGMNNPGARDVNGMTVQGYGQKFAQAYGPGAGGGAPPAAPPVTVLATPPGGGAGQPAGLTINMDRPGVPQGSAENVGMPPTPSPQGIPGPVLMAQAPQAPAIPDVPRPRPTPQQIEQYQQRFAAGEFGTDPSVALPRARAALEAELDRDWGVQRDRAKMQFGQQTADYNEQQRIRREQEKDDRNRSQPTRQEIEKLHTARSEAATIVSALEDFRREFENTGTFGAIKSVAGATTPVNTAYNAAALLAKGEQLFNLGVLNGPDLDIIRRTLPDPSTMKGALTSTGDMSAAVNKVIDLLQTRLASREKQLGLPVTDVRGAANEIRATMPGGPTQQPTNGPIAPGAIEEGYRFKGGNPADKNNWERVR